MARGDARIGTRVRYWRGRRGLSQVALAGLAGISQAYLSQIETGRRPVDSRATLARLADALQVSTANLEGQPADPRTREQSSADAAMPAIRAALAAASLGDQHEPSRSLAELTGAVDHAVRLRTDADYARLAPMLPDLIADLHAVATTGDEHDQVEALRLTVPALYCCTFTAKYFGYPDLAMNAAEHSQRAAERLGEPVWQGVADFTRIQSLPPELKRLSRRLVAGAVARLEPVSADRQSGAVYGMLHLVAALVSAVERRGDDVNTHLTEAHHVAARLGESRDGGPAGLWFGPTNVAFWRTAIAVELGEGARVRELVAGTDPRPVRSATRHSAWYSDIGRGLAQTHRDDQAALGYLMRAENIAPQRIRLNPAIRETVAIMLRRARRQAIGDQLRALAERVGVV